MAVGDQSSLSRWLAYNLAGVLAAIATFSVTSVLLFAVGAPLFLMLLALMLSILIGLLAQRQDRENR
jgi:hypothetical protein